MSKYLPPKFGTMPVISSLKSGRDRTISSAVICMPSSTIRRTVFVCAKVARGRTAIAQSTVWWRRINPLKSTKIKQKRKNKPQNKPKETERKTIEVRERGLLTFSAEKPKTWPIRRDFFFLRIYKPPQGCFIERPTPPYLQKGNENKKGTKLTLTIYKVSGN